MNLYLGPYSKDYSFEIVLRALELENSLYSYESFIVTTLIK